MKRSVFCIAFVFIAYCLMAQTPTVNKGRIQHFEQFPSAFVTARNIDVWLPENYSSKKKYAVVYMHDGQMLFDSSITWNKQEWGVDECLSTLLEKNQIRHCIVVGIWNGGANRHIEFCPQKPFEALPQSYRDSILPNATRSNGNQVFSGKVKSDLYLQFIVKELKPFIDRQFSTKKNAANTFLMGSSMGGLISLYGVCEYPKVFGGAACLSTHWPVLFSTDRNPFPKAIQEYLVTHLPNHLSHIFYFDYGDQTLDAMYKPYQMAVDSIMQAKGYGPGNWLTLECMGADHSERSWKKRLDKPMLFLLRKK